MFPNETILKLYMPLWNKYRPAILKMMIDCDDQPQQYKLSSHEFKAKNPKHRGGYNFILHISKGRALNHIKDSVVAQELLELLQLSKKATELTATAAYEISLDEEFVLRVCKKI